MPCPSDLGLRQLDHLTSGGLQSSFNYPSQGSIIITQWQQGRHITHRGCTSLTGAAHHTQGSTSIGSHWQCLLMALNPTLAVFTDTTHYTGGGKFPAAAQIHLPVHVYLLISLQVYSVSLWLVCDMCELYIARQCMILHGMYGVSTLQDRAVHGCRQCSAIPS